MRFGPIGWAWRILAFAAVAAPITLGAIDRASGSRPSLAQMLPAGLGGEASLVRAQALLMSDPTQAGDVTAALVAKRPVPASHLSLRALYLVESDRPQEAGAALTAAAQRGWRDRYVQVTVLGSALASGQPVVAAQRLEALMRNREDWAVLALAAEQVMNDEAARQAFAQRIAQSPGLSTQLVQIVQRYGELAPVAAETFLATEAIGTAVPCEDAGYVSRRLLAAGTGELAGRLWYSNCGSEGAGDLAFRYTEDQAGPFDWQFERGKGVATRPGSEEGTLNTVNRSPVRRMVAYRYASLPEGRHAFRLESKQARRALDRQDAQIEMTMKCGGRQSTQMLEDLSPLDDQFEFDVPADCPQQVLAITSGRGRTSDLKIVEF